MRMLIDGIQYNVENPWKFRIPWKTILLIAALSALLGLGMAHGGDLLLYPQGGGGGGFMVPV